MISLIIPYRPSESRQKQFDFVLSRYTSYWPDLEIIVSDNEGEFSRAAARNRGVEKSSGDMLILADADTVCNKANLESATNIAAMTGRWVLPYNDRGYFNLSEEFTRLVLSESPLNDVTPNDPGFSFEHQLESWAGLLVLPREAFEVVNGYDERFQGWGYEDNAFRLALDCIWGKHVRTDGYAYHLFHDIALGTTFDSLKIEYNRKSYEKYMRCAKHKERMLELVKGNR